MARRPGLDDSTEPYYYLTTPDEETRPWLERLGIVLVLGTSVLVTIVAVRVVLGLLGVW